MQPPTPAAEPERVPRPPPGPAPTPTEQPPDGPPLQVSAAAHRVGVAPSTLRTWDRRYGIGPTDHTPGRHRRYSPDDLARLDLMHRALIRGATPADAAAHALTALPANGDAPRPLPATTPALPDTTARADEAAADDGMQADDEHPAAAHGGGRHRARAGGTALRLPGAGWRARGLGRAALALDADTVRGVLVDSIAAIGMTATWNDVTRPVLAAVAQRWVETGAGIEIEHLLSDCVTGVFGAVAATPVPGEARPVLLAGMAGDQHRLPLVVLAATLTERGVSCRSLGSDLPQAALTTAIRRTAPAAVLLWSQLSSTADPQVLRELPRTRPGYRGFVAGPGWAEIELPPQVGRLGSLEEATEALSAAATA